jgi:glycosyltransferase involved in cell wall biosynthesis
MTFCIITHVVHGYENGQYFAYSPYVKEMNIWLKQVDKVIIVAPIALSERTKIHLAYEHPNIEFRSVPVFNYTTLKSIIKSLFLLPLLLLAILRAMRDSDHIHLRCPGNMGLLGCLVQIFFPGKPKTAKYAGNWDPNANQPLSYKWQRFLLKNTLLTRKMQVLVYGDWPNSSRNVKPFFTATYLEKDKEPIQKRSFSGTINFLFVGSLTSGKQPIYALQLIEKLIALGFNAKLSVYGEGVERIRLEQYIHDKQLLTSVLLFGNQEQQTIKDAFQRSHFVVLPSKSEGWPKVLAEGMFWGCVPVASKVSCVPSMVGHGERGVLLSMDVENDVQSLQDLINDPEEYQNKVSKAVNWSRLYTLDYFEAEIQKLLMP